MRWLGWWLVVVAPFVVALVVLRAWFSTRGGYRQDVQDEIDAYRARGGRAR